MELRELLDLYDDWNTLIKINDDELNTITVGNIDKIVEEKRYFLNLNVVSFGFYDNMLCVRVK